MPAYWFRHKPERRADEHDLIVEAGEALFGRR